ncbi:MAG: putative sulfate exporter family transporter [Verrucomicrobia bacterium]|nr:putative sulfate exporter family transporter [Verrucomicrobiota bacterium]
MNEQRRGIGEDWLAVWMGLGIFVLSLGTLAGTDLLGWSVTTKVWTDLTKALAPVSDAYAKLPGVVSLVATYLFMLVIATAGAAALRANVRRFAGAFTVVFWISYACWVLGSFANIAATSDKLAAFKISWSLQLTAEAGFIVALAAGLIVGNFLPRFGNALREAIRPEWYVKTAIVLLGGFFGVAAAGQLVLAKAVLFRGVCAIIEAYLIYWGLVYFVARKYFKFPREWAAPLASGISICGVSAAIATGAAIRARPVVPIMVSSLVVIFAVVELVVLPFAAQHFLVNEPMVAGAWMGLAVKTDGAAVASGAVADSLIRARAFALHGVRYQEGWIMNTASAVKVFIDVFIGVWAFILAVIWSVKIERREGDPVRVAEIWQRFPKFVLGYMLTFAVGLTIGLTVPALMGKLKTAMAETNVFRGIFFVMTFFTIGVVSDFKRLAEEGIGKLALVYVVCLFGFIIWIGLAISWIFFHGIKPPLIVG